MDFREIKEFLSDTFKYILVFVFVLFMVIYVISLQQVVGPSMDNTLKDKDVLILNKAYYTLLKVERNDIVAFKYDDTKYLIKRVIGLPGERVEFKNNTLYVNDEIVEEPFLKGNITADFNITKLGYTVIPKNMYLMLGDNRGNSLDSRKIGLIDKSEIMGKVILRVWPITGFNIYW